MKKRYYKRINGDRVDGNVFERIGCLLVVLIAFFVWILGFVEAIKLIKKFF